MVHEPGEAGASDAKAWLWQDWAEMGKQMEAEIQDLVRKVLTQVQSESREGYAEDPVCFSLYVYMSAYVAKRLSLRADADHLCL